VNHTHEHRFHHTHEHKHENLIHTQGHYHIWSQTHDHGEKTSPHCHKDKLFHPGDENVHHHALESHQVEV